MADAEDVGNVLGCLGCVGLIALKVAVIVAAVWIILHFVFKYW